jgi:hypothetical protein
MSNATFSNTSYLNNIKDILKNESEYVSGKSDAGQNSTKLSQRSADLINSFNQRYSKQTQIVVAITVAVAGYIGIMSASNSGSVIPSLMVKMLSIILVLSCVFYILYTYLEINGRSNMKYTELDIPTTIDLSNNPLTPASFIREAEAGKMQSFLKTYDYTEPDVNQCTGDDCCPDGYVYDETKYKCVFKQSAPIGTAGLSGFTTISESYVEPRFIANGMFL